MNEQVLKTLTQLYFWKQCLGKTHFFYDKKFPYFWKEEVLKITHHFFKRKVFFFFWTSKVCKWEITSFFEKKRFLENAVYVVYLGEPENLGEGLKFLKNHFSKNILVLKRQKKKIHRYIFKLLINTHTTEYIFCCSCPFISIFDEFKFEPVRV